MNKKIGLITVTSAAAALLASSLALAAPSFSQCKSYAFSKECPGSLGLGTIKTCQQRYTEFSDDNEARLYAKGLADLTFSCAYAEGLRYFKGSNTSSRHTTPLQNNNKQTTTRVPPRTTDVEPSPTQPSQPPANNTIKWY